MPQELTLPVVVTAALVDSINPCAFAVLLTFVAANTDQPERDGSERRDAAHPERFADGSREPEEPIPSPR